MHTGHTGTPARALTRAFARRFPRGRARALCSGLISRTPHQLAPANVRPKPPRLTDSEWVGVNENGNFPQSRFAHAGDTGIKNKVCNRDTIFQIPPLMHDGEGGKKAWRRRFFFKRSPQPRPRDEAYTSTISSLWHFAGGTLIYGRRICLLTLGRT